MTIETALKDLLNPLLAGGCHNTVNRTVPVVLPYAVFYEIWGEPSIGLTESYLGLTRFRYQIDTFAKSPEQAKALAQFTVAQAVTQSADLQGTLMYQMNGEYSPADKSFQYIIEVEMWYPSLPIPFPMVFPLILG